MNADAPLWSVIVIARNEERRIGACLTSVFDAFRERSCEVIVVDSASTDRTVEIAQSFPASIVRLGSNLHLSPAAGRHVGFKASRGELLLFMDGDSVLEPGWVGPALEVLEDPKVGGVAGIRETILEDGSAAPVSLGSQYDKSHSTGTGELLHLGGPALYPRKVLETVGGFNPFLYAGEEAELGARIVGAGYMLKRLDVRMTRHRVEAEKESLRHLLRRVRVRFPCGVGQLIRHAHRSGVLRREHFAHLDRQMAFLGLEIVGLIALLWWAFSGRWGMFAMWLAAAGFGFAVFCIRARSVRRPSYYIMEWAICGPMALWGFLMPPHSPEEYPWP